MARAKKRCDRRHHLNVLAKIKFLLISFWDRVFTAEDAEHKKHSALSNQQSVKDSRIEARRLKIEQDARAQRTKTRADICSGTCTR